MIASRKSAFVFAALLAAAIAAVVTLQQKSLRRLRAENTALRQELTVARDRPAPTNSADAAELDRLRAEHEELLRLRGQVAQLRRERDELARKVPPAAARTNTAPATQPTAANAEWVQQMLNAPLAQQAAAVGALRAKMLRGEPITAAEMALRDALSQRQLNSLERSPSEFAEFQTSYVQNLLGLSDPNRTQQIRDIIQRTYEHAVANGLDIPSKPATGFETWVDQRNNLDRRATSVVQGLLTPEERQIFDRALIGIMGVDIGTGVDKSNYPPGFLGN